MLICCFSSSSFVIVDDDDDDKQQLCVLKSAEAREVFALPQTNVDVWKDGHGMQHRAVAEETLRVQNSTTLKEEEAK